MLKDFAKNILKTKSLLKRSVKPIDHDFDAIFYAKTYHDLRYLGSKKRLFNHYVNFGQSEGRFPNLRSATAAMEHKFGRLPNDFDIVGYRALNPDLYHFGNDDLKYISHFLEFGVNEGRKYIIDPELRDELKNTIEKQMHFNDPNAIINSKNSLKNIELLPGDIWTTSFVVADFIAWSSDWREETITSRDQAIRIFIEAGIRHLCPINNDFIFDPEFYKAEYFSGEPHNEADLYAHWLKVGYSEGYSPNESVALQPYIGRNSFPSDFNYVAYCEKFKIKNHTRINAIRHLFDDYFPSKSYTQDYVSDLSSEFYIQLAKYYLVRRMYVSAESALRWASRNGALTHEGHHILGDVLRELGRPAEALASYRSALTCERPSVWSFVHAVQIASALGRFDAAFDIARNAKKSISDKKEYLSLIIDLIDKFFNVKAEFIHGIYKNSIGIGGVDQMRSHADSAMISLLDQITLYMKEFLTFPVASLHNPAGHVVVYGNDDLKQCTHYRIEQKLQQFRECKISVRYVSHKQPEAFNEALVGASAVIFYRIAAFPNNIRNILTARSLGIKTYYEIDDLIFDSKYYPDTIESYGNHLNLDEYASLMWGVTLFKYAMALCDFGIASTKPLIPHIERIVQKGRCLLLPNGLDVRNDNFLELSQFVDRNEKLVSIFYGSGTKAHNADFTALIEPALIRLMSEYDAVRLVIVGYLAPSKFLDAFSDRITFIPFISEINRYWSILLGSSINVSVLLPGEMSDCKSEIKWLEAAALGIPSVVSHTKTYESVIEDGKNGLLASSADDWYLKLKSLVIDSTRRIQIGNAARISAQSEYSLSKGASILGAEFGHRPAGNAHKAGGLSLADALAQTAPKLKVLLCHVFFAPQSIGGATRVVEDNVRFAQKSQGEVDMLIFATDEGREPDGLVRFDSFGPYNIVRISTPLEKNMDWRPFNEYNEALFERLIDAYNPDVVHFHCMQRLSASALRVALKKRIPYCVTLHDGWWISDDQFLIDEHGLLKLPGSYAFDQPSGSITDVDSLHRRIIFKKLLAGASARISVSESFKQIYEQAGISDVDVIENGVDLKSFTSSESYIKHKHLRLGHIGGRSAHKGAVIIEAIFRRCAFSNLSLTIVDGRLKTGDKIETTWGNTPVTICGPYPQAEVQKLYSLFDVLLAPSTWPESFGLVTREAIASGKWVVASKLGAIGDCVLEGINGFLVDSEDPTSLRDVLRYLDQDYEKFKNPPLVTVPVPDSDKQGQAIIDLYHRLKRPNHTASRKA